MIAHPLTNRLTFDEERWGETLIVAPPADLGEFDFDRLADAAEHILDQVETGAVRNVVVDFRHTDVCGSTALAFFVRLWKQIRVARGKLVFCNLSSHEREIIDLMQLGRLWPICDTLPAALANLTTLETT